MSKTIRIDPITRIEGHGKVTLTLDEQGQIARALFCVKEFRGFEKFCEGALAENLPRLMSRICGICPVSHCLAATKAVEDCFKVTIPATAIQLRELLLLGQVLESHVLSLAFLSLPDLALADAPPRPRNVIRLAQTHREAVERALELRDAGLAVVETVGRRAGSPIGVRIGGMVQPLAETERQALLARLAATEASVVWFGQLWHSLLEQHADVIETLGDIQTAYMGLGRNKNVAFYDGDVRVIDRDGRPLATFSAERYSDFVEEKTEDWSYMKFSVLKSGEHLRVGPLARVNLADEMPTPLANAELEWFRSRYPRPTGKTLCYHAARWVEAVYAFERCRELLSDTGITGTDIFVKPEVKAGVGVGVVEAPRGTLVHRYELDGEGKTVRVDLCVATQHNNLAFNDALKQTATQLIRNADPDPETLNKLEMVIRAFDPCLSCSTHVWGEPSFKIELRDYHGHLVREWR